ncbi:MAG: hypothetical protein HQK63_00715 [Desulfamplus sp.]|nr:hypothetical protein [Desulfamplus sp.]
MKQERINYYKSIFSNPECKTVFEMRQENSSEKFDTDKAIKCAENGSKNFWAAIDELDLSEIV